MRDIRASLEKIYGPEAARQQARYEQLAAGFRQTFGEEAADFFRAPGRVEIGGNHTDHQHGCAVAAAVTLDTAAAVRPRTDGKIVLQSEGYPLCEIVLDRLEPAEEEKGATAGLLRGMAACFAKRGVRFGKEAGGFTAYVNSSVPAGSGLSSSAAFEILIGTVFNEYYCGGSLDAVELAELGQYVENVYFGKPCGLLDQLASSLGGIVYMDFKDPAVPGTEKLVWDPEKEGCVLCIIHSGAGHENLTGEYAAIPAECQRIAAYFGKKVLREVPEELFEAALPALRKECGDRAVLRALHIYDENRRALAEAESIRREDMPAFLKLVNASGRSSALYLQNVIPSGAVTHQEMLLTLALCERFGAAAFRVHGGGFGGTAQAYVPAERWDHFKTNMESVLGTGSVIRLRICPLGGSRL